MLLPFGMSKELHVRGDISTLAERQCVSDHSSCGPLTFDTKGEIIISSSGSQFCSPTRRCSRPSSAFIIFLGGKMSNSRWSILTIVVLLAAGLTFAQTSQESQAPTPDKHAGMHHSGESADQHLQMLSEKLNLTDDQKAKLKPVFQGQMQQMNAVREDSSLSQEQKRAKMKSIHESLHDQINAVLTPEQQAKFEQMRQEQMEKHKGMKEGKMDHE
jgi:periplasmic protein CpxP/Spy